MKVILSEIKENLQGTNSRVDEAKNQISDLEHREEKNFQSEQKVKKELKNNEDRLRSLWDNFKHTNIWNIGVLEEEEKEQKLKTYLKK